MKVSFETSTKPHLPKLVPGGGTGLNLFTNDRSVKPPQISGTPMYTSNRIPLKKKSENKENAFVSPNILNQDILEEENLSSSLEKVQNTTQNLYPHVKKLKYKDLVDREKSQ